MSPTLPHSALQVLKQEYGFLFQEELMAEIESVGIHKQIEAGNPLMEIGQYMNAIPLILKGSIKVLREDTQGNELLLYYLERGDTCAMSFSCCMSNKKSKVKAIAELDSELIMLPVEVLDDWMSQYKTWKSFVFDTFNNRLDELIETVDKIAFLKLDERLLQYLRDKAKVTGNTVLPVTHQEIADDLHTSRVVISRLLKQLEKKEIIQLGRNKVEVLQF